MAVSAELIECVICSENLLDPRALPCGHSYCGPPRPCLTGLKNPSGGICCAICRVDHDLKPEDIKPLFGIRDLIQGISESRVQESPVQIPCSTHQAKDCTLWCKTCDVMICFECIGDEHDGHPVRKLKSYLVEKIESQLGKPLQEGVEEYKSGLMRKIERLHAVMHSL